MKYLDENECHEFSAGLTTLSDISALKYSFEL